MNILLIIIPFLIGLYLSRLGLIALYNHRANKTLKLSTPRTTLQGTKDEQ